MKKINDDGMLVNYSKQKGENMLPRQKLEPVFIRNGAIYASKTSVLFSYDSLVGPKCLPYIMATEKSINIDSMIDFKIAENLIFWIINEQRYSKTKNKQSKGRER